MSSTTEEQGFLETPLHPGRIAITLCGLLSLQPLYIVFRYLLAAGYREPEWEHLALFPSAPRLFNLMARALDLRESLPPQAVSQYPLPPPESHITAVGLLLFGLILLPTIIVLLLRARKRVLEKDPTGPRARVVAIFLSLALWGAVNVVSGQGMSIRSQWTRIQESDSVERSWRQTEDLKEAGATIADRAHLLMLTRGMPPDSVVRLLRMETGPAVHFRRGGGDTVEVGVLLDLQGVDPEFRNIDGRKGRVEYRLGAVARGTFVITYNAAPQM